MNVRLSLQGDGVVLLYDDMIVTCSIIMCLYSNRVFSGVSVNETLHTWCILQIKIRNTVGNREVRVKVFGWVHECRRQGRCTKFMCIVVVWGGDGEGELKNREVMVKIWTGL